MLNLTRFMPRLFLLLFLYTMSSCHSNKETVSTAYNNYKFDLKVIEKLPLYDSLASAIWEKLPVFQKYINESESYQAYRYMPSSSSDEVYIKLPKEAGTNIEHHFTELGKNFIYGFDVFKDSSIKIYVRIYSPGADPIDIEENLSYYPAGSKMKQREFPVKDTVLNEKWQYWTLFNNEGLF